MIGLLVDKPFYLPFLKTSGIEDGLYIACMSIYAMTFASAVYHILIKIFTNNIVYSTCTITTNGKILMLLFK